MEITTFDPAHITEPDLTRCHELYAARWAEDRPTEPPMTRAAARHRVQNHPPGLDPPRWTVARIDGTIAGIAQVLPMIGVNADMAMLDVTVHPSLRRRGIGTALLRHILTDLDHPKVAMWNVSADGPGEHWALTLGLRRVYTAIFLRATISDIPSAEPAPKGYRLLSWRGPAPDAVVASYATARTTITEAPTGAAAYQPPKWTVKSVRDHESRLRSNDFDNRVVVALHGNEVVALSELFLTKNIPHRADQGDTAVLPAHRGKALGRCIKLHQIALLRSENSPVKLIYTANAQTNTHMLHVNTSIGFKPIQTLVTLEARTADLR